jgi:hypothetical protein
MFLDIIHRLVHYYVFTPAKTTSTLAKNEMNFIINMLTLWSQDRLVGVVMRYELDGQSLIPSPMGVVAWGVKLTPKSVLCSGA